MSICALKTTLSSKLLRRTFQNHFLPSSSRIYCQQTNNNKDDGWKNNFPDTTSFTHADIPKSALYLGFGGVIPFVTLALASGATNQYMNIISTAQVGYAACILTFLGGVHWGKELNKDQPDMGKLTLSVIPSLYAWSSFCLPHNYAMYYLSAGLVGAAVHDFNDSTLPGWYRKLRIPLTMLAASSVLVTGYNIGS